MMVMLVLGVSFFIFSSLLAALNKTIAGKVTDKSGNPKLSPEVSGAVLGVVFFAVAFFLGKKFKNGILVNLMQAMGATGIAFGLSGVVNKYLPKQ